jgi:hypothetical protein
MLRIEVDMFSGRPNPVWILTDSQKSEELLGAVSSAPGAISKKETGYAGLGYRELFVESLGDDPSRRKGVPDSFSLGSIAAEDFKSSMALAQRLVEAMPVDSDIKLVEHTLTPLDAKLRDAVLERMKRFEIDRPKFFPPRPPKVFPLRKTVDDVRCAACQYEISKFNPGFWNAPSVRPYNNCYNYARNWRTNTFAQPGRAHGAQTSTMACGTVTAAAMADGLKKRCDCLPKSEYPRRHMALVIDPGWDYHWYREQIGGFWGHKPGSTAAKNTDNAGVLITNPETCARGGYTDFCDYFYAGKSVVIN